MLLLVICQRPALQLVFFPKNFIVQVGGQNLNRQYEGTDPIFLIHLKISLRLGHAKQGVRVRCCVPQCACTARAGVWREICACSTARRSPDGDRGQQISATLKTTKKFSIILSNGVGDPAFSRNADFG